MLDSSLIGALIVTAYGIVTTLSSFQTLLILNLTSGGSHAISVVVFEKENLMTCKETIKSLIQRRYDNTNVTANTDRVIDALNQK